jgi:PAS domain S-box-containing protein
VGNKPANYNEADIELVSLLGDFTWEIVERKRAEEALGVSELRYRRLFESSRDGLLLLDADKGTVYDTNPSLLEMLGYSHEEIVGKELWEIGPVKNIETAKDAFRELLKQDQAHFENLPIETGDGRIIEVEIVSSVYEVNRTRVVYCNIRDITERKALEKLKADFYAMITHDIRSPLTVISGYSELLLSEADKFDAETKERFAAILKNSGKLESLIENFLSISKMEAGKLVINPAPTVIAALLRDACSEVELAARVKKLDLITEIADGLPEAMVDSRLIQRAVLNLLQNAVNYTPTPGKITLKASLESNDHIMISVADTGEGIPDGEQQTIFEKYYRSGKTVGAKGTGLGLAIVKAAAEAHGGRVEVESEVGKGSTFRLYIPVKKAGK